MRSGRAKKYNDLLKKKQNYGIQKVKKNQKKKEKENFTHSKHFGKIQYLKKLLNELSNKIMHFGKITKNNNGVSFVLNSL